MVWVIGWIEPLPSGRGGSETSIRSSRRRRVHRRVGHGALARVDGGGDLVLQPVERLAGLAALVRVKRAEALHHLGDPALAAQCRDPQLLQGVER